MLESVYQGRLIKEIQRLYPGAVVVKNDPNYIQGFPDLTVLIRNKWAVLEVKTHKRAEIRPNQMYYIEHLNRLSFASFIFPENEAAVLDSLKSFVTRKKTTEE